MTNLTLGRWTILMNNTWNPLRGLSNPNFQKKYLMPNLLLSVHVKDSTVHVDTVAEWLRRSTRNRLGLSRVGSSPTSVDSHFYSTATWYLRMYV